MDYLLVALSVFGLVFVGELPDKTAVAALILGTRYPAVLVLIGIWAAFLVHVVVAVTIGGFLANLPRTPVELVTAALFLVGAILLLRSDPVAAGEEGARGAEAMTERRGNWQIIAGSFGLVLVAEFGDLTQILTATLAARYDAPLAVGMGALVALWTVSALAVMFGRVLLRVVPLRRVQQIAAVALIILSITSVVAALR